MVKLYCDRCGKEIEGFNERNFKPLDVAANGDDLFFSVDIHHKHVYDSVRPDLEGTKDVPGKDYGYHYDVPDLCVDCLRKINDVVKTVWDGIPNWEKEQNS